MRAPFGYADIDLSVTPATGFVHIGYCKVNAFYVFNHTTAAMYLQIFDLGRAPVLGVDKPTFQFGISGGASANQNAPPASGTFVAGLKCQNGLAWALTTASGASASTVKTPGNADGAIDWELRP